MSCTPAAATPFVIALLYLAAGRTDAVNSTYSPALSWDLCSPSRIRVTLTGAVAGGIIYIKGYGAACKQETFAAETEHEFDFDACGIDSETYFTMIVQKNPLYQTGSDLQESMLCIYDLSDITVSNGLNVGDKDDDAGVNKTVKPTATMKLYREGQEVGGASVKLTDLVTMSLMLDEEFIMDFDIKAKYCSANYLDIIIDYCAEDTALFPEFVTPAQGALTSTFGAFRTTDLGGGYVEMTFSCTVQVCRGLCSPTVCANGNEGRGRRRRALGDEEIDVVNVGASFSVGTDVDIASSDSQAENSLCIDNSVFIIIVIVITAALGTSMSVTSYVTHRLMKGTDALGKLGGTAFEKGVVAHNALEEKTVDKNTKAEDTKTSEATKPTKDKKAGDGERRLSTISIIQTNADKAQTTVRQTGTDTIKIPETRAGMGSGAALNNRSWRPAVTKQASVTVMFNAARRSFVNNTFTSLPAPGCSPSLNAGLHMGSVENGITRPVVQNGYISATHVQHANSISANMNGLPNIGFQTFQ